MRYSNPRRSAVVEDWPSGRYRVRAEFVVEFKPGKGERVSRITEKPKGGQGAPKRTTYGKAFAIVDGDDGHTYAIEHTHYDQVCVWLGTLKTNRYLGSIGDSKPGHLDPNAEERTHVLELLDEVSP